MAALTPTLTAGMAGSTLAQGAVGMVGAINESNDDQAIAGYNSKMYAAQAGLDQAEGADATARGATQAQIQQGKVNQVVGAQRAGMGAQGVNVNTGSAAALQNDTKNIGEVDTLTIKNNAWRQAWGYQNEAISATGKGALATMEGNAKSNSTLLAGGLSALGYGIKAAGYYTGGPSVPTLKTAGESSFDASGTA